MNPVVIANGKPVAAKQPCSFEGFYWRNQSLFA
jgi:hypothetical protein